MPHRHRKLVAITLSALACAAQAQTTSIDFDNVPSSTNIISSYRGVVFSFNVGGVYGTYAQAHPGARSGTNVVTVTSGNGGALNSAQGEVEAGFVQLQKSVSIDAQPWRFSGTGPAQARPILEAFDSSGNLIQRAVYTGRLPEPQGAGAWETLTVTAPSASISRVRFTVPHADAPQEVFGLFDNLKFSTQTLDAGALAARTAWSAAADFAAANPNGVWSYRARTGSAAPVPLMFGDANCTGIPGLVCWNRDGGSFDLPMVGVNASPAPISIQNLTVPMGTLSLHPGPTEQAIVTFTVPSSGAYRFSGQFQVADRAASGVKVSVTVNGALVDGTYPRVLAGYGETKAIDFVRSALVAGQQVDFIVDNNGSFFNDTTELTLSVLKISP